MADPISQVADMIRTAEKYADDQAHRRLRAIEYYNGEMNDVEANEGRSQMVSRDVRDQIKKVLPSLMRTMLGSDKLGEFEPVGPGDEEGAQQATDYVNLVVAREANLARHIEDATHDALLLRNGILHAEWEEKRTAKVSQHSGLDEYAFSALVNDDDVTVLEHTSKVEEIEVETPQGVMVQPVELHDVTIKRIETRKRLKVSAVPLDEFIIDPDAISLEDAVVVGRKLEVTRSDLIAMGYDRELVEGLTLTGDDDTESDERRDTITDEGDETHKPNELIDYYDVYVRFDMDDDGIAELHHMCFAGSLHERNKLHDEECDEVQYYDIKVMTKPHQWEGIALFDDVEDIQRAKTVLLRQTLDNLYWKNNPQPIIQAGVIQNPEAVYNPEFGLPIEVGMGTDVRSAMGFAEVPFVAAESFGMLDYFDRMAEDRTGVTDASGGLAPDALQNMTAKASAMLEQAGIGQAELMARTLAEGLRRFFRGILRLIVRHQDIPRTVRLRGEWVQFDPRHWNTEMDFSVNVGLGAGTRERDMMMMQQVMGLQEKFLAAFGPDNPFVSPENLWASTSRMVEAAGLRTPQLYFTEPDPQRVQALIEAQANQPDPETAKAQAQMQIEQMKVQTTREIEQIKAQARSQVEQAQMQADLTVKQAEIEAETARQMQEGQRDLLKQQRELDYRRWETEYKASIDLQLAERRQGIG